MKKLENFEKSGKKQMRDNIQSKQEKIEVKQKKKLENFEIAECGQKWSENVFGKQRDM